MFMIVPALSKKAVFTFRNALNVFKIMIEN